MCPSFYSNFLSLSLSSLQLGLLQIKKSLRSNISDINFLQMVVLKFLLENYTAMNIEMLSQLYKI